MEICSSTNEEKRTLQERSVANVYNTVWRKKHVNLPNALTFFRIVLIPVYAGLYLSHLRGQQWLALAVFAIAGLTDVLDGRIARRRHQVTSLGKILDPAADKLLLMTVIALLAWSGEVSWWVAGFLLARDLGMLIGGLVMLLIRQPPPAADQFGKMSTLLYFVGIFLAVLRLPGAEVILWMAVIATFVAAFHYLIRWRTMHVPPATK